ncbi:restriction endonuclease [Streptomyces sp. SID3343]|uniref:restriction endonuclease n=1 Tax=Streptomyces sp. SID3343 TaxID=2690260 RepID=UPI00136D7FEB|nr:restriction endonuclease [Streptomyces sp. SID3343]MYV99866.1 hypothetical protein [Streptomyces sp. SID3343]
MREQIDAKGITLAELGKEINFSKGQVSANLSGATPRKEFITALIRVTETSPTKRERKTAYALELLRKVTTSQSNEIESDRTISDRASDASLTQRLIASLESQVQLERSLRLANQTIWFLLGRQVKIEPEVEGDNSPTRLPANTNRRTLPDGPAKPAVPINPLQERQSVFDLYSMSPLAFEGLVRELFQRMGYGSWAENKDIRANHGFDAVVTDPAPLVGGIVIVEVKRYRKLVGFEIVRAFAGAIEDQRATKGILITSSWFGKASHEFAARHGRIELIDGSALAALIQQYMGITAIPPVPPSHRDDQPDS